LLRPATAHSQSHHHHNGEPEHDNGDADELVDQNVVQGQRA
jgi:hypothetical protein